MVLVPGSPYTLGLSVAANSEIAGAISSTDTYAGGMLYAGGSSYPAYDAVFAEGIAATGAGVVPEPSTWTLLGVAVGAGVVALRRRVVA